MGKTKILKKKIDMINKSKSPNQIVRRVNKVCKICGIKFLFFIQSEFIIYNYFKKYIYE